MWPERTATLAFLLMEALLLFAVATALAAGAGGDGPSYVAVALAALGGFGVARGLQRFDVGVAAHVGVAALISVPALLVLLNLQYNAGGSPLSLTWLPDFLNAPDTYLQPRWPQTWGVLFVIAAWARGALVAQQDLTYGVVLGSFSAGLAVFAILLLFGQGSRAGDALNLAALPFLVTGLLTLSLVHLRESGQQDQQGLGGPWLAATAGTVLGLALISAAVGLFPLGLLNTLLAPVGLLALRILDLLIFIIAVPIGWLAERIINSLGASNFEWPESSRTASDAADELEEAGDRGPVVSFFLTLVRFAFVLALVALAGYILYRVFRRLRRPPAETDVMRESVDAEGGLGDDLRALYRGLLGRFRRREAGAREPDLPPGVLRLRRLYVRVLDDAAEHGAERPPAATPGEFAPVLTRTFASPTPERLSDRFAAARYGRVEPPPDTLTSLEREVAAMAKPPSA